MKIELKEEDVKIIEKAEKIVGTGERNGRYTNLDDLIGIIENLIWEVDRLEEKIEDRERDIEENYKQIETGYSYYGLNERDFH